MKFDKITIEAPIGSGINKVWEYWNSPEHIVNWYTASKDWHTPSAKNDLSKGGKFSYRMEAKDGSFGFDFSGKYDLIEENSIIAYTLDDDRKVKTTFDVREDSVFITQIFEAETQNPIEMQKAGWQAILNNFKEYVESN